jgi:hypothetical protein
MPLAGLASRQHKRHDHLLRMGTTLLASVVSVRPGRHVAPPRPGPAGVIAELSPIFDGWELASWFAKPNLWIADAKPIDLVDECLGAVLGAARADRFIAAG